MEVMVHGQKAVVANLVEVEQKQEQENATDLPLTMEERIVLVWDLHLKHFHATPKNAP